MEKFMLFLRGLAAMLIAVAVGSGAGMLLSTVLPSSDVRSAGIASMAVMIAICWLLYPLVTGVPRHWVIRGRRVDRSRP